MSELVLYLTFETMEEAEKVGSALVKERLVACVNILPGMRSMFWWEGKVESASEVVMIAKTREDLLDSVIPFVKELHSYEVPCIVALPVVDGNPEFLSWIGEETR